MSNITYNKYLKFKKDTEKSYSEKFSKVRIGTLLFSYFGNILSIFFAYFFFMSLFSTTLFNINPLISSAIVIIFLTLFEYIKRYVFDIFSIQYIKNNNKLFKNNNISFLFMTLLLIGFSFFFSLNGAKKIVNKQNTINNNIISNIKTKKDSIINYYTINYITDLKNERKKLIEQKNSYLDDQKTYIKKGWNFDKIIKQIDVVDNNLNLNKISIDNYMKLRNDEIKQMSNLEYSNLDVKSKFNNINIIYFVSFSILIELIIMFGVYYNRIYENISKKEYEQNIINTVQFKKWSMSNIILDMIFATDIKINDVLPSTNSLIELINLNEYDINKKDLIDIIRVFTYLKITETRGNRRFLKMNINDAKLNLNNYFKIK